MSFFDSCVFDKIQKFLKAFHSSLRFKFKIKVVIENSFKVILSEEVDMKCIKCPFRNARRLCISVGLS